MVFSLGGNGNGGGSGITGLGSSLLSSWYSARLTNSALSTLNATQSATQSQQSSSSAQSTEVLPPWDVRGDLPTADEKLRAALGGGKLVRIEGTSFDKEGVPEDQKTLFGLYNALDRLSAIAGHAADKSTSELLLSSLDRRFQEGLAEVKSFLSDTETEGFTLVAGDKTKNSDSSLTIARTLSQFHTGVVHRGSLSNAVSGLTGSEVFTVQITKGGVATDVTVDLSTISGTVTLDSVVGAFNDALETAGLVTRFKRVEIEQTTNSDLSEFITEEDEDSGSSTAEKAYGLAIEGVSTEVVRLSASDAEAAVYLSGVSGRGENEAGQLLKVKGIGGTAEIVVGSRIEAADAQANAAASALDSEGNLYVVGNAQGAIDGLEVKGEQDVFLSKYNSAGDLLYTRLLGSAETAEGFALAIDSNDNVVVAGQVTGKLGKSVVGGGTDAFVTKYSSIGAEVFTRQISPLADDGALGLTTDATGAIYVTGYSSSAVASGQTHSGKTDAVVTKLESDGTLDYHRQFGTSGDDRAVATAIADDGDLLVASIEDGEAVLRKFDASSGTASAIWEVNLGDLDGGQIGGIAVDGSRIYLAGSTSNASLDAGGSATVLGSFGGASDGFLTRIDDAGSVATANFTRYISTGSTDKATALTVSGGKIYVAGETQGELSGATQMGTSDGFALRFDENGTQEWIYQYGGREGHAAARGISVDESGASSLDILGLPRGAIQYSKPTDVTDRSSVRPDDFFYVSVDNKRPKKITIEAGDSLRDISVKVNSVLLLDGSARVRRTSDGDTLRIEGELGVRIDILPGEGERDALKGLGLKAGTIYDDGSVLDEPSADAEDTELILGLGLLADFSLKTRSDAAAVVSALEDALSAVRKAYREITKDPALEALITQQRRTQGGTVPESLRRQLSNYQAGLNRLQGGGSTITGLF